MTSMTKNYSLPLEIERRALPILASCETEGDCLVMPLGRKTLNVSWVDVRMSLRLINLLLAGHKIPMPNEGLSLYVRAKCRNERCVSAKHAFWGHKVKPAPHPRRTHCMSGRHLLVETERIQVVGETLVRVCTACEDERTGKHEGWVANATAYLNEITGEA